MSVPALVDTKGVTVADNLSLRSQTTDEEKLFEGQEIVISSSANSSEEVLAKFNEPPDSYESKHRWDPKATWTPQEETKLRRKLDLRVAFVACVCFAALQLDRGNIGNALSDNMLVDLHMTTANYNLGQTIFYLCFLAAELPSQMISKKLGSDVWIPIQMMSWSAVAIGQVGLTGKNSFYVTRALLGLIEGGFVADTVLYLSYYYTANELTIRLSFFWVTMTTTQIVGSFLAAGILELRHKTHLAGWRWLFAIEGTITFLIGVFAFFYLPPGPTQTHQSLWGRITGKGWLTEREEIIVVNKVLRDDHTKSQMHNRQGLDLGDFWRSLTDFDLWPLYLLGLITYIAPSTVNAYFTLNMKGFGFTTFQTNMLTIPSQVIFIVFNLSLSFLSKKLKERTLVASLTPWYLLILFIALVSIPDNTSRWGKWALLSLIVGYPYPHPILVSMNSMNSGSVRTRTVASSLYNMFVQASSLVASNVYQPSDAPYYHKGNRVLLGIIAANIVLFWFAKAWYILRNKQRDKVWDSMTTAEKEHYLSTTKDLGNKRLDFRFLH